MKLKAGLGLLLLLVFSAGVYAQDAAETVEKLRAQFPLKRACMLVSTIIRWGLLTHCAGVASNACKN